MGEQFSYSYVTGESRSIYVSAFSKSFLLVCIVLEDKNIFADSFEDKNEFELAKENFIAVNEWSARYANFFELPILVCTC